MRDVDNEDRARVSHLASRFPILRCRMTNQVPGGMQSALSHGHSSYLGDQSQRLIEEVHLQGYESSRIAGVQKPHRGIRVVIHFRFMRLSLRESALPRGTWGVFSR